MRQMIHRICLDVHKVTSPSPRVIYRLGHASWLSEHPEMFTSFPFSLGEKVRMRAGNIRASYCRGGISECYSKPVEKIRKISTVIIFGAPAVGRSYPLLLLGNECGDNDAGSQDGTTDDKIPAHVVQRIRCCAAQLVHNYVGMCKRGGGQDK